MRRPFRLACLTLLATSGALYASAAYAVPLTVLLVRGSLSSDPDPDNNGLWQYEGGVVENAAGTANIGHYIATRRLTNSGTNADNTAAMTITLFFPSTVSGAVPNNVTLEGAWSYTSGQFAGSVSAVSSRYRPLDGADATASSASTAGQTKLIINTEGTDKVP